MKRYISLVLVLLTGGQAHGEIVKLGPSAAENAITSDHSVAVGESTGSGLSASPYSALFGNAACQFLSNSLYATCIGPSAGRHASGAEGTIFLGLSAGYYATEVKYSIIQGYAAGRFLNAGGNTYSLIYGYAAGEYSNNSHFSVLQGMHAGYRASDSAESVMIGKFAGAFANNSPGSVFIGQQAGGIYKMDADTDILSADYVVRGIYIGSGAGKDSANTTDVILIGTDTKAESGITNAIGIGIGAHVTQSNSVNLPPLAKVGGGILITDEQGNITSSDALEQALAARVTALEHP